MKCEHPQIRFERLRECLARLSGEGLYLSKPALKDEGKVAVSLYVQTPMQSYKEHEESGKYDTTKKHKNKAK